MSEADRARPSAGLERIGIVGAGTMGAGLAVAAARAGMAVSLIDREPALAEAGKARGAAMMAAAIEAGQASADEGDRAISRIRPGANVGALRGADLVIESVAEDRAIKAEVIATAAQAAGAQAIFGSNTSSLPIASLAPCHPDPALFLGIHFFAPADRTRLVEIIPGARTGERALGAALAFARALGRTPIVVADSRGFYTSRLIGTYIREGHLMLAEGVAATRVEEAARSAGMALGPLALNDQVGLDVSWAIVTASRADLGVAAIQTGETSVLEEMVLRQQRIGEKAGGGFYDYDGGKSRLWPGLADLFPAGPVEAFQTAELRQRLLAVQALEAARLIQQGVVRNAHDADIGSVLGVGFPSPGALSWIDATSPAAFVALCRALTGRYGSRFRPNRQLVELAEAGESYHAHFPPTDGPVTSAV
jgi:3-hydroxyacyl-CoA dehydrogenase/enoyl-CoA hydratase/3-hydroxybutyryl-CoA epimerase